MIRIDAPFIIGIVAAGGLILGLGALWRGLRAQRTEARLEGVGTSPIATLAAGEVRVTGLVETAGTTVKSPILGLPVVFYDSKVRSGRDGEMTWRDSRAVSFFVRDGGGSIRVLPRGATWDIPLDFDDTSGGTALSGGLPDTSGATGGFDPMSMVAGVFEGHGRRVTEACLEPGDPVTVIGRALPYADVSDPAFADSISPLDTDPEVAADMAAARAAGTLADDPREAWGNAAIPGFGIGQPTRAPELDPAVTPPTTRPEGAAEAARTFDIAPDALVLASTHEAPLLIAGGAPAEAVARSSDTFLIGLLGAALAIGSAIALALAVSGRFGS